MKSKIPHAHLHPSLLFVSEGNDMKAHSVLHQQVRFWSHACCVSRVWHWQKNFCQT